jgi:hypothetical protein
MSPEHCAQRPPRRDHRVPRDQRGHGPTSGLHPKRERRYVEPTMTPHRLLRPDRQPGRLGGRAMGRHLLRADRAAQQVSPRVISDGHFTTLERKVLNLIGNLV